MAPRLIFAAATGRCGTGFLAHMLSLLPDVTSLHEPQPDFVRIMRAAQRDPALATQFWEKEKLPAIHACETSIYIETSHLFCKGFAEPLDAMGIPFDLIDISRPHREVACSLFRLNTIPARTTQGLAYYVHPGDPVHLPLADWESLHDYQLCYWYCLEIAQRRAALSERVKNRGGRVSAVTLQQLSHGDGLQRLLEDLNLPAPRGWGNLRWSLAKGRVVNKQRSRRELDAVGDLDAMEREVIARCQDLQSRAA